MESSGVLTYIWRRSSPWLPIVLPRIEARLAPETLAIVRHAAQMEGRSVSDFVASAAYDAAIERIDRHEAVVAKMAGRKRWSDPEALEAGYAAMAADVDHERDATEWIEALISDIDPDV